MNAIRHYRRKIGLTQAEVADRTDITEKTIRRWETGEREPRASDIKKLCSVLEVTESELLNGPADNGELKFSFIFDMREVEAMEVRMNEFKVGTGDDDIFGVFRVPKNLSVDEIGAKFMNYLRAELAGDKVKRAELKKLEDGQN